MITYIHLQITLIICFLHPSILVLQDHFLTPDILAFLNGSNPILPDTLLNDTRQCTNEIHQSSLAATQRFSQVQLAILCRNRQKWTSQAFERNAWSDPGKVLTQKQQRFLDHFYTCQDMESCICRNRSCHLIDSPVSRRRNRRNDGGVFQKALRKEYRRFNDEERNRFHAAINRLKADTIDGLSKYDLLVLHHTPKEAPGAHWGPAFLPWHREMLKQLELALRNYDSTVSLPYWDSTLDEGLPNPADSILWTDQFLGSGSGGVISSGPFQHWQTYHSFVNERRIVRNVGQSPYGALYRQSDLDTIMNKNGYPDLTSCVDPFFELMHGAIHLWVGGHMLDIPISPNDPVFFLHHSFVDYIWEEFRQKRQSTNEQRDKEYPPESRCCSSFHYANVSMSPFPLKNEDGLSTKYTDLFYNYEDRPSCSQGKQCGSPYLICDRRQWRCLSKVRLGGNCSGFENLEEELCHNGKCTGGICQSIDHVISQVKIEIESTGPPGPPAPPTTETSSSTDRSSISPPSITQITDQSTVSTCKPCDCSWPGPPAPPPSNTNQTSSISTDQSDFISSAPVTPNIDQLGDEYVWFTITVLKGRLGDPVKEKVHDSRVIAYGLNYNGTFEGRASDRSDYPYYPGITFVRVRNPRYQPGFRTEAQLSVYGSTGKNSSRLARCHVHCRFDSFPCTGKVTFDLNPNTSSSAELALNSVIPFSTSPSDLLFQNGQHQTDFFVFLCDDSDGTLRDDFIPKSSQQNCVFQRFENFLLVGFAEIVEHNISLAECKQRCRRGITIRNDTESMENMKEDDQMTCASIMHWQSGGLCVLTSQSRLTQPHVFAHFPNEGVFYFDYICDVVEIFER